MINLRKFINVTLIPFACSGSSNILLAQATTTYTTYVVKTQEERRDTRFTLTEWLRIKERMKLMDVWLAMFSSPEKSVFRPEINLEFHSFAGSYVTSSDGVKQESVDYSSTAYLGQLWLTNIISGTTGLRTFNIDLGYEGYLRATDRNETSGSNLRYLDTKHHAAAFRLFGKNIQDTSLVLKYGSFTMENSLAGTASEEENPLKHIGTLWGGDLQIYFNNYLGIYGRYNNYLKSSVSEKSQSLDGDTIEYGAFVEISLLRLSMGIFDEEWNLEQDDVNSTTNGTGILTSARLQF